MKIIILPCLVACALFALIGCSDTDHSSSTTQSSSAMTTDSKDMQHR